MFLSLQSDGASPGKIAINSVTTTNTGTIDIAILTGSTIISYQRFELATATGSGTMTHHIPVSCIWTIDSPGAGTYTYKVQAIKSGTGTMAIQNCKLVAREL